MEQVRVNERTSEEAELKVFETSLHLARSVESLRRLRISPFMEFLTPQRSRCVLFCVPVSNRFCIFAPNKKI